MSFRGVILGLLLLGRGVYVIARRKEFPDQPKQVYGLDPLQDVLGDRVGSAAHWGVFVVVPLLVGAYLLFTGLGFDRIGPDYPASERIERAELAPDTQVGVEQSTTQTRLTDAGFLVSRLEGGKGLSVSGDHFEGSILQLDTGWRVVCDERSFEVASLADAETKILECHRPQ
jgi:hypothetical protein